MYNILNDYVTAKLAASNARKAANTAIATDGNHVLPEACDKAAIHKAFTSLARANKNAKAVLDDLNGAAIFAEAEAKRAENRAAKMKAEHDALENAINSRLDEILADDYLNCPIVGDWAHDNLVARFEFQCRRQCSQCRGASEDHGDWSGGSRAQSTETGRPAAG